MRIYMGTPQLPRVREATKTGIVERAERHWIFIPESKEDAERLIELTKEILGTET